MLVLSRRAGERIRIAEDIVVVVKRIDGERVRIGIDAPQAIRILRGELSERPYSVENGPAISSFAKPNNPIEA